MKKYIISSLLVATLISCDDIKLTEAQRNAKQFTIERIDASIALNVENVKEITVGEPDTIISDMPLSFAEIELYKAQGDYYQGIITHDSIMRIYERASQLSFDIRTVAQFCLNDSLKNIYKDELRLSYPVHVKFKSGDTRNVSVVMDRDGITPRIFRHKLLEDIDSYDNKLIDIIRSL